MKPVAVTTKITVTKDHEVELTRPDLIAVLRGFFNIPENARLYITTPGGADYSNTDLEIGSDLSGLKMHWVTTEQEEDRSVLPNGEDTWKAMAERAGAVADIIRRRR